MLEYLQQLLHRILLADIVPAYASVKCFRLRLSDQQVTFWQKYWQTLFRCIRAIAGFLQYALSFYIQYTSFYYLISIAFYFLLVSTSLSSHIFDKWLLQPYLSFRTPKEAVKKSKLNKKQMGLEVIGTVDSARFQKAKIIAEKLQKKKHLECFFTVLSHTDFEQKFGFEKNPIVLWRKSEIGSLEEFQNWALSNHSVFVEEPMSIFQAMALKQSTVTMVTQEDVFVQIDIQIQGETKSVTIQLFASLCPKSVEKFLQRAVSQKSFTGKTFSRVSKGCFVMLQESEQEFIEDESFHVKHTCQGLVGLSRQGQNKNSSAFYFTLRDLPHLDNKFSIIGKVSQGIQVIRELGGISLLYNFKPVDPPIIRDARLRPPFEQVCKLQSFQIKKYQNLLSKVGLNYTFKIPELQFQKPNKNPNLQELTSLSSINLLLTQVPDQDFSFRKTKIMATVGPASVGCIRELIQAGTDIIRINMSFDSKTFIRNTIEEIRQINSERISKVAVLLDTNGPTIRVGPFEDLTLPVSKGRYVNLTNDRSQPGNPTTIPCNCENLNSIFYQNQKVIIGNVQAQVVQVVQQGVKIKILESGTLKQGDILQLQDVDLPILSQKDRKILSIIGVSFQVDFLAITHTQSKSDILDVRSLLGPEGDSIKLIAKIQSKKGIKNLKQILPQCDGVMVNRGNLSKRISIQKLFLALQYINQQADHYGKPSIICHQILSSMAKQNKPTRAESTDIANLVIQGWHCLCLSEVVSIGKNPVLAVRELGNICQTSQNFTIYGGANQLENVGGVREDLCRNAVITAQETSSKLIVVFSKMGGTTGLINKFKPKCPVLVVTDSQQTIRKLSIMKNCIGFLIGEFHQNSVKQSVNWARQKSLVQRGDKIVAIHSMTREEPYNTDVMTVIEIDQQIKSQTYLHFSKCLIKIKCQFSEKNLLKKLLNFMYLLFLLGFHKTSQRKLSNNSGGFGTHEQSEQDLKALQLIITTVSFKLIGKKQKMLLSSFRIQN